MSVREPRFDKFEQTPDSGERVTPSPPSIVVFPRGVSFQPKKSPPPRGKTPVAMYCTYVPPLLFLFQFPWGGRGGCFDETVSSRRGETRQMCSGASFAQIEHINPRVKFLVLHRFYESMGLLEFDLLFLILGWCWLWWSTVVRAWAMRMSCFTPANFRVYPPYPLRFVPLPANVSQSGERVRGRAGGQATKEEERGEESSLRCSSCLRRAGVEWAGVEWGEVGWGWDFFHWHPSSCILLSACYEGPNWVTRG